MRGVEDEHKIDRCGKAGAAQAVPASIPSRPPGRGTSLEQHL